MSWIDIAIGVFVAKFAWAIVNGVLAGVIKGLLASLPMTAKKIEELKKG